MTELEKTISVPEAQLPASNGMRIALAITGALGAIFAPPWVTILCMGILAFRYPAWEILFLGLLTDFLWLPAGMFHPLPTFTISALILIWGLEPLRKEFLFS